VTQNTDRRIELRLPNVRLRAGGIAVANVLVRTPKRVGAGGGAMVQELVMLSEILAIQESGIVFSGRRHCHCRIRPSRRRSAHAA
jgi:DNA primase catalytic subunit